MAGGKGLGGKRTHLAVDPDEGIVGAGEGHCGIGAEGYGGLVWFVKDAFGGSRRTGLFPCGEKCLAAARLDVDGRDVPGGEDNRAGSAGVAPKGEMDGVVGAIVATSLT